MTNELCPVRKCTNRQYQSVYRGTILISIYRASLANSLLWPIALLLLCCRCSLAPA